jgi:NADP-dependent 3-hydroxy acid dehydrogenase YdfG
LAVTRALAGAGCRVVMLARDPDTLRSASDDCGEACVPHPCDVSDPSAVRRECDAIAAAHGVPDIVVNNAGMFELSLIENTNPESFTRALDVNLVAPFTFIHAFIPSMRERGSGHFVNIGSIADRFTFPENGAYAASKFGMRALHQVLREELRGSGVRASLVSPAPVDTALWDSVDPDNRPGFTPRAQMLDTHAVGRAVLYVVTQPPHVNVDELRLSRS